jgi:hypothetical protein
MIEDQSSSVRLPGGLWIDGTRYQEAWLRPVVGADEAQLETAANSLPLAAWTTAILTRCLAQLGPFRPVTANVVRSLCVGDREALILHLRQLTLGDRMPCVVNCPGCGQALDLALHATELLVPPYQEAGPAYDFSSIDDGEGEGGELEGYHVRFRLATGADQEEVAMTARTNVATAAVALLERCVIGVRRNGGSELAIGECTGELANRISRRISEVDAQAELSFNLHCPECQKDFSAMLDAAACFRRELSQRGRDWCREVHFLAYHYHWSEQDILAMPTSRRRRYVELLADSLRDHHHA